MATMNEFLCEVYKPETQALYHDLDQIWNERAKRLNRQLRDESLPVRIANMSSIWVVPLHAAVVATIDAAYYLRAEGLAPSWIGTKRLIFSLNYTEADFDDVAGCFYRRRKDYAAGWLVVAQSGDDK